MTQASAPGKIILFGEHAVVYGRPAIAVPLPTIRAFVEVDAIPHSGRSGVHVEAPDIDSTFWLDEANRQNPLALAIRLAMQTLHVTHPTNLHIAVRSDIPIAAGLGSGAAVTVAIIRGLCGHFNQTLTDGQISELAFEVERIHHGTPSGVDNTVIAHEKPVYFRMQEPVELFTIAKSFTLLLAHSGISAPTGAVVRQVQEGWQRQPEEFEQRFDAIARIVDLAYSALKKGDVALLGPLMDQNQMHLRAIGVSSVELDNLIQIARSTGATGAKLSGAGQGGFMIALVEPDSAADVKYALQSEGASPVLEASI